MEGTVKFFNRRKGFGFVSGDDGKDYFVHFTALGEGTFLRDNDRVSFEPAEGERGLKAEKVALLEKASDRSDLPAEEGSAPAEETPAEEPAQEEAAPEAEEAIEEESAPEEETPAEEPAQEETPAEEPTEEPKEEEAPAEEEKKEE
jgi:cold shock protein